MKNEAKIINIADHIQNNIQIEAGDVQQSTTAELTPQANLGRRVSALLVDFSAIVLVNYLIFSAYAIGLDQLFPALSTESKLNLFTGNISLNLGVFILSYWTYFFYTSYILKGKTLGKIVFGLRIIDENFTLNYLENDHHINLRQSIQRANGYLLCYLSFGTFFIFNFASEDNRGLSDYISMTRTVDEKWLRSMIEHKEYAAEVVRIEIRSLDKVA